MKWPITAKTFQVGTQIFMAHVPIKCSTKSDFCKSWRSQIVVECLSSLQLIRPCPKHKRGNTIFIACLDLIGGTHLIKRSTLFESGVYLSTSAKREAESSANLEPNGTGTLKFTTTKSADPLSGLTQRLHCDMTRTDRMLDLIHFTGQMIRTPNKTECGVPFLHGTHGVSFSTMWAPPKAHIHDSGPSINSQLFFILFYFVLCLINFET